MTIQRNYHGAAVPRMLSVLLLVTMTGMVACASSDSFRPGMSKAEAIELAGRPDVQITEAASMKLYLLPEPCASKQSPTQLLVYKRWLRSDLVIALDTNDEVICAWTVEVVEFVN
jgi:hypothetical protein